MRLSKIFTDGVILQANKPVRIFGTGRGVATLELDGVEITESFDTNDWMVELPAHDYGGPYVLTAKLNNDVIRVEDVHFGDVCLIAGQSNMDLRMDETNYPVEKYQTNDAVRLFTFCYSKIVPLSLKAVAWYQGESNANASDSVHYEEMLSMLIDKWREDLGDKELPFVIIQIADYFMRDISAWCAVQDAQARVCEKASNTHLVISRDVCENDDIHPQTKDKLSHRVTLVLEKL